MFELAYFAINITLIITLIVVISVINTCISFITVIVHQAFQISAQSRNQIIFTQIIENKFIDAIYNLLIAAMLCNKLINNAIGITKQNVHSIFICLNRGLILQLEFLSYFYTGAYIARFVIVQIHCRNLPYAI